MPAELQSSSWRAYEGLAQAYYQQYKETKKEEDLNLAQQFQHEAIKRNQLNGKLRQKLEP